jgi:hypothetical protein
MHEENIKLASKFAYENDKTVLKNNWIETKVLFH